MGILGDLIHAPRGRLTLESGVPISTSDQTAKTTIYFTPYLGNAVPLYNTAAAVWYYLEFSQISLSLAGFAADKNNDVFVYNNAGTLALERVEWTNDSTRATGITLQDGRYVKSGDASRLYVGTFRTTAATGQCEDSIENRFVWNYYNRVERRLFRQAAAGDHTYATDAWRPWGNSTNERVRFVVGVAEVLLNLAVRGSVGGAGIGGNLIGVGGALDATNANDFRPQYIHGNPSDNYYICDGFYHSYPVAGYHYIQMTEWGSTSAALNFYGGNNMTAMLGFIWG